jgi:hypothetical protein
MKGLESMPHSLIVQLRFARSEFKRALEGLSNTDAHRLLPAEVRARSRVTALIEYGAQGQYVAVCPRQGVLALVPDSPEWFD